MKYGAHNKEVGHASYRPDMNLDSWRWIVAIGSIAGLAFGGLRLAKWSSEAFGPFYAPVAVGVGVWLFLQLVSRMVGLPSRREEKDDQTEGRYDGSTAWKPWLDSLWFGLAMLVPVLWLLAGRMYPLAYKQAFEIGESHQAFLLGFWSSWMIVLAGQAVRDLFKGKAHP